MLALSAIRADADDPLGGIELSERPKPVAPAGWTTIAVRAAALNHHDLWTLRGVSAGRQEFPRILGCDGAGIDENGEAVVVHTVISDPDWRGDVALDPHASLLSERHDGTFAQWVAVPRANLVRKPAELTFEDAACMPTAWLTAYRMLFSVSGVGPGATVLVQGAGGGVATALIALGRAAGMRIWTTSRSEDKRARATELGADATFAPGERLPERVDAVMETVGAATWEHSIKSVRAGGVVVVAGMTSGDPQAMLGRIFLAKLRIVGVTMGTRDELERLLRFCVVSGVRPPIHETLPLMEAKDGFAAMASGELFGKVVFTPPFDPS